MGILTQDFDFLDYRVAAEKAFAQALLLRQPQSLPTIPETAPLSQQSGNNYYIDGVAGSNAAAGNAPNVPWKDVWKISGSGGGAGATWNIAADGIYDYAETWANYKNLNLFSVSNLSSMVGSASAPMTIRPYYPRGYTGQKPKISWYALMQAADWTQETGISGGKVWSAAWAKSGNAYYNVGVAFGASKTVGVAYLQQNTSGVPASLNAANQYAVDVNKVYVYVPDGSNPNTYYGEVRIFGGAAIACFTSWAGASKYVRILGLQFELCAPVGINSTNTTNSCDTGFEVAFCSFNKCLPIRLKNASNYASGGVELDFQAHDNEITNALHSFVKIDFTSGNVANTVSYRIFRNKLDGGNLSASFGGALIYSAVNGGTFHHVWGNYVKNALNSSAGEQIDGSGIYFDVNTIKAVAFGNIVEQSGKAFQANSALGVMFISNLAIDCGSFGSITNTTGDLKAPSIVLAHNTYLWTGRIALTDLRAGPNIGGPGVGSWAYEPIITIGNSQANTTSNTAYSYTNVSLMNNLALNVSDIAQTLRKSVYELVPQWSTVQSISGNAAAGFGAITVGQINTANDLSASAGFLSIVGSSADAKAWMPGGAGGLARPAPDSPLVGRGHPLSQVYPDIAGRNFAVPPTVGCFEAVAA